MKISDIQGHGEGTIVTQNGEYGKLAYFNNENPYYEMIETSELTDDEQESAIRVSDFFDDHLDGIQ